VSIYKLHKQTDGFGKLH